MYGNNDVVMLIVYILICNMKRAKHSYHRQKYIKSTETTYIEHYKK